jgi:hypothetical protein
LIYFIKLKSWKRPEEGNRQSGEASRSRWIEMARELSKRAERFEVGDMAEVRLQTAASERGWNWPSMTLLSNNWGAELTVKRRLLRVPIKPRFKQ